MQSPPLTPVRAGIVSPTESPALSIRSPIRRRTGSFSSNHDRSPTTPHSGHRFSSGSRYSADLRISMEIARDRTEVNEGGMGNLADELDQLDDEDDYDDNMAVEDVNSNSNAALEAIRDSGIDVSYMESNGISDLAKQRRPMNKHADFDDDRLSPGLEDAIDDMARLCATGNAHAEQTVPSFIRKIQDLGNQSTIESGVQRLNTNINSMSSHLTKESKSMQSLSSGFLPPFGITAILDVDALEACLPLVDELIADLPLPDSGPYDSLQKLSRETDGVVQTLASLLDTLQMGKQTSNTASRHLRTTQTIVADLRRESELAENARYALSRSDAESRIQARWAAQQSSSPLLSALFLVKHPIASTVQQQKVKPRLHQFALRSVYSTTLASVSSQEQYRFAQHNGFAADQQHNNHFNGQQSFSQAPSSVTSATSTNNPNSDIPKDEVGWYFVEQYYTTLSKNPDRLYLYYNKRSQFVSGNETDKVQVCVGQRAINDRIKELDFQDCKVRITNVDSQASDQNIVIQVIGEISNKSQPHHKFTQTFVLATQTNGYFVLNDIFRYVIEEEDEAEQQPEAAVPEEVEQTSEPAQPEPAAKAEIAEPKSLTSSADPAAVQHDASVVAKEIEKKLVNGSGAKHDTAADLTKTAPKVSDTPERPTEPEPTPLPSPPKQVSAQPAAAPKPSAPKSWASLAASANKSSGPAKAAVPAVPAQRSAQSAKTSTTQTSAPVVQATQSESNPAAGPGAAQDESAAADSQDEWTAVGSSHARQQSRQVNGQQQQQHQQQPQQDGPQRRGYIKNVRENVSGPELRETLEKFGKISYFDIAQQKNCAFVDFDTAEGYQAAVAANPHTVGGESFTVEERKMRPGSTPYIPRGQFQGGRGGRGDFRGGRGGFPPRGRGQGNARGGRGAAAQ